MKKVVANPDLCIGCGACESACSQAYFKVDDRGKSAIRVSAQPDGKYRIDVCDQCGDCMTMCSPIALTRGNNDIIRLNKKKCVGCLICVAECVKDNMHYHDDERFPFKCVACGICVKQCPSGALTMIEE